MISVAAEKGEARTAAPNTTRPRGELKKCPFQPCPTEIPQRWLACAYHWSLAPPRYREANKRGGKTDHWLWVYSTVVGLVCVCWSLDEGGIPKPWETEQARVAHDPKALGALAEKAGHLGAPGCVCDWCGPLYRWALKVADISKESWELALKRHRR